MNSSTGKKQPFAREPAPRKRRIGKLPVSELRRKQGDDTPWEDGEWQKTIIQTAMDGFWMADRQGQLLEVNQTYCQMSGYSEQELLAMKISDLEVTEAADETSAHIRQIMASGEDRFETRHRRKDGVVFNVEVSVQYRPVSGGRLVAFMRDITRRKQTEDALRENEEKFETFFNSTSDGILIADATTREIIQGNATISSMLGYSKEELEKLSVNDLHPPHEIFRVLDEFEKQLQRGKPLAESIPVLRKDGSIFYADVASAPATIEGRRCLIGAFRDITERRRTEEDFRAAKYFLDSVLDNLTDSLIVIDTSDHSILRANRTFLNFCGLTGEEVIGRRCSELNHNRSTPHCPPAHLCPLEETLRTGQQATSEHIRYDREGNKHYFVVSTVPIKSKTGRIHQVIHLSRDVTDRKQQEQLVRQQREEISIVSRLATVGEFAASIAHEIHQPLTAILNNARAAQRFLLSDTPAAIDEVREALNDIVDDDMRAAAVIQHLRSFLKGRQSDSSILDMNEVIEEVLTILHAEIVDRQIHMDTQLTADIPPIMGVRTGLQQVLMNLILNGCDSMLNVGSDQRRMDIRTSADDPDNIVVAVRDSGTGLDIDKLSHVFDHFYTTKPDGLGMGLPISKSIITAHGGSIWAANNPGGGATFFLSLPTHK